MLTKEKENFPFSAAQWCGSKNHAEFFGKSMESLRAEQINLLSDRDLTLRTDRECVTNRVLRLFNTTFLRLGRFLAKS